MQRNKIILTVIAVLLITGAGIYFFQNTERTSPGENGETSAVVGIAGDPRDIVVEYYLDWLDAVNATSSNPTDSGLTEQAFLSNDVRMYLKDNLESSNALDPLLCQSIVPDRLATKEIFSTAEKASFLVTGRTAEKTKLLGQAVVSLSNTDGLWVIESVECDMSAMLEDREFTFERQGFLLKSVPEPLNSDFWHLVFVENDIPGHTAPLYFDANSMCTSAEGVSTVCDESTFIEPTEVLVQGQMSEAGVEVVNVEFK